MSSRTSFFSVVCAVCVLAGFVTCRSYGAETMTNQVAGYIFTVPEGYVVDIDATTGLMKLVNGSTLSSRVPQITVAALSESRALEDYGVLMDELKRRRYQKKNHMRLLKKFSLRTVKGVTGWELSYLTDENTMSNTDIRMLHCGYLLDRDEGRMLRIRGTAPYDRRNEFFRICDQFVNSIAFVDEQ